MSDPELLNELLAPANAPSRRACLEARASEIDDALAEALKARADDLLRSNIQESLQVAQLLVLAGDLSGNPARRALGLRAEANALSIGLGQYSAALEKYDEAAAIYRAQGRTLDEARAQIGKLWPLSSLGRYDEALRCGDWVAGVLEAHADWRALATVTMNVAVIHGRMGKDAEALEAFNRARDLYIRIGAPERYWVEQNRAQVLRNLGRFDESIQASVTACRALEDMGQPAEAARARHNLAITYFVQGRYNESLQLLDQARSAYVADGRLRDVMEADLFASDCLLQLRRFAEALEKCRQSRAGFAELGAGFEVAQACLNEASALTQLGKLDLALDALSESRKRFEQEGNAVWVAIAGLESAGVLQRQGQTGQAFESALASRAVFQTHGLLLHEAQANLAAAHAALGSSEAGEALHLAEMALQIGQSHDLASVSLGAYALLGELAERAGDAAGALAAYDHAIEALERLRGHIMLEYRASFVEDKQAIYASAARLSLAHGDAPHALAYAERAKSRALLDLLAYRLDLSMQARTPTDEPLVSELNRLRAERDQLARRWQGEWEENRGRAGSAGEPAADTERRLATLERQITQGWHDLLIRNADYARDAPLFGETTAVTVLPQAVLADDAALVEYFAIGQHLAAFVATPRGVEGRLLENALPRAVGLTRALWLNVNSVPASGAAQTAHLARHAQTLLQQLHTLLIEPLRNAIGAAREIIVVPHGPLHYLPFHAFHDGESPLLQRHEIRYLPSAGLLRHGLPHPRAAAQGRLRAAVFAHAGQGRLPFTLDEARAIAALLGSQAYLAGDATAAALRDVAPVCDILHIAAHAEFRADNPLFSGVELADRLLTTLDVFGLRLNAWLVTLSACHTGRSVVSGGDELLGLTRAFLSAGAASLLLSLWQVEDESTARLMSSFYTKLMAGMGKAAALREAQLEQWQGAANEAWRHPYFWAPFVLVGDAGR